MTGPDHAFAIEPDELTALVAAIREVEAALGTGRLEGPSEAEAVEMYPLARSSVVAAIGHSGRDNHHSQHDYRQAPRLRRPAEAHRCDRRPARARGHRGRRGDYVGQDMTTQAAPRYIRYCTRCVMPETKPDLFIDEEGVCSACRSFERRGEVDWDCAPGRAGRGPRPLPLRATARATTASSRSAAARTARTRRSGCSSSA